MCQITIYRIKCIANRTRVYCQETYNLQNLDSKSERSVNDELEIVFISSSVNFEFHIGDSVKTMGVINLEENE